MESRIERLCIDRGLKMTGQRRVVARVLSDAADHPDVEELYRRASALDQHISIATVYRTVRLFEENGILERRDFGGGRARYEPTEDGPHYHLIDVETGKVVEFQDPEHERLMHAIAARLGFDVVSLRLELFGRRRNGSPAPERRDGSPAPERRDGSPAPGRRDGSPAPGRRDGSDAPGHRDAQNETASPTPTGGRDPRLRDPIKDPADDTD
jgi:Fur family ferric uptake transcriptional regulator